MTANNISLNECSIKAIPVGESKRNTFLRSHFGNKEFIAESAIFNTAYKQCPDYKGGYWNFYELTNGGFYLAPAGCDKLEIFVAGNGFQGVLSADAIGIVICLFVINGLAWKFDDDMMVDKYYMLRDYALDHGECSSIFGAID